MAHPSSQALRSPLRRALSLPQPGPASGAVPAARDTGIDEHRGAMHAPLAEARHGFVQSGIRRAERVACEYHGKMESDAQFLPIGTTHAHDAAILS